MHFAIITTHCAPFVSPFVLAYVRTYVIYVMHVQNISLYDVYRLNCSEYWLFSRYVAHVFYCRMYFVA